MKILIILFSSFIVFNGLNSQTDLCPNGARYVFDELNPIIDLEKKTITFPNFDCMNCEFADRGVNCRCRKACGNDENCLKNCGEVVPSSRVIKGFVFRVETWYSTSILSAPPPMTDPDETFTDDPEKTDELPPCYTYTFTSDWNIFKSICVMTNLAVQYTDGTCCIYNDLICKEIN